MGRHISSDIISIHALREEGDTAAVVGTAATCGFLSTPSVRRATCTACRVFTNCKFLSTPSVRRATDGMSAKEVANKLFLSTPSVRRATFSCNPILLPCFISIHALREEGDLDCRLCKQILLLYFYPRPP